MKKSPIQVLTLIGAAGILLALGMVGCFQPFMDSPHDGAAEETASPGPSGPLLGEEDPFVFTLEVSDAGDARAAGDIDSLKNRLKQHDSGTRNYTQVLVLDEKGSLVSFADARDSDGSQDLTIYGINFNKEYTFLVLMGHWEREQAGPTQLPTYVNGNPPTLLAAGYTTTVPNNEPGRKIPVIMGPVHVTAAIEGTKPILDTGATAGLAQIVELPPASTYTVMWTIKGTGFRRLFQVMAKDDPATPADERDAVNWETGGDIFSGRRLVKWSGDTPSKDGSGTLGDPIGKTSDSWTFTADAGGPHGAVNFNLDFTPIPDDGWNGFKDVRGGIPSKWIIRNGVNDKPQDGGTNFCEMANWKTTANGNGAAVFAVKPPLEITAVERVYDGARTDGDRDRVKVSGTGFKGDYSCYAVWGGTEKTTEDVSGDGAELYIPEGQHTPTEDIREMRIVAKNQTPYFGNTAVLSESRLADSPAEMIHPVSGETTLEDALEKARASRVVNHTLKVSAGISTSADVTVNAPGKMITIQGEGSVTITNNGGGPFLNITGGEVILGDGLTLVNGIASYMIGVDTGGRLTMKDGSSISGGSTGVAVNGGAFDMRGGEISGIAGSGVVVSGSNSTFTMAGGTISNNTSANGGVNVTDFGSFTMAGGTISGNSGAGGVVVSGSGSTFTMNNGTISGNGGVGGGVGGGVVVSGNDSTFTMNNGTISGNGGVAGVWVEESSGTFTMNDGTISGNSGSGVQWKSGAVITKSRGIVYGSAEMDVNLKNAGGSFVYRSNTYGPTDFYN